LAALISLKTSNAPQYTHVRVGDCSLGWVARFFPRRQHQPGARKWPWFCISVRIILWKRPLARLGLRQLSLEGGGGIQPRHYSKRSDCVLDSAHVPPRKTPKSHPPPRLIETVTLTYGCSGSNCDNVKYLPSGLVRSAENLFRVTAELDKDFKRG